MSNVVKIYPKNSAENPDNVLEQSIGEYEIVLIIGYDLNGDMDVRASTNTPPSQILWMMERFKHKMINGDYSDD